MACASEISSSSEPCSIASPSITSDDDASFVLLGKFLNDSEELNEKDSSVKQEESLKPENNQEIANVDESPNDCQVPNDERKNTEPSLSTNNESTDSGELQKILYAQEIIEELTMENTSIRKQLECVTKLNEKQQELLILLQNTLKNYEKSAKEKMVENADNQKKELELANEKIKEMETAMEKFQANISELQSENTKLKETIAKSNFLDQELLNLITERATIKKQFEENQQKMAIEESSNVVLSNETTEFGEGAQRNCPNPNTWRCDACTFLNDPVSYRCEICTKSSKIAPVQPMVPEDGLQCYKCTFVNNKSSRYCQVCGFSLKRRL